jgi:hypothetical protein
VENREAVEEPVQPRNWVRYMFEFSLVGNIKVYLMRTMLGVVHFTSCLDVACVELRMYGFLFVQFPSEKQARVQEVSGNYVHDVEHRFLYVQ